MLTFDCADFRAKRSSDSERCTIPPKPTTNSCYQELVGQIPVEQMSQTFCHHQLTKVHIRCERRHINLRDNSNHSQCLNIGFLISMGRPPDGLARRYLHFHLCLSAVRCLTHMRLTVHSLLETATQTTLNQTKRMPPRCDRTGTAKTRECFRSQSLLWKKME